MLTLSNRNGGRSMSCFRFSQRHILKSKKELVKLILIIYFILHTMSKILSFEHVTNTKISEICYLIFILLMLLC